MSEIFSIKTEPLANDYKPEESNNDANAVGYRTTKLENVTNVGNDIEEDELDLDKMEEFLPENITKSTVDVIKEEDMDGMDEFMSEDSLSTQDVDQMEEFLPEDSPSKEEVAEIDKFLQGDSPKQEDVDKNDELLPEYSHSFYSASSFTWKSDDRIEGIIYDEEQPQHVTQQHLTNTTTQHISLPKLEIIDVHEEEQNSKDPEINGATDAIFSDNKERFDISSARVAQTPTEHKCEICCKSYIDDSRLRRHVRFKHPLSINAEYICKICNQSFTTQTGLDKHSYRMHPETQPATEHKCEICGKCYTESTNLRLHIIKTHPSSTDLWYICEICSQRFSTQTGLQRHFHRTHPETQTPREHKCKICDRCYTEDQYLRRHIRDKHPLSLDTEYICGICHKRFNAQIGLDVHLRMHPETKHKCELCDCSFTEYKLLRAHIKNKHPPQHNCEICGKCYIDDKSRRRHIRDKHPSSIDTEYICEMCGKRFTTQVGLLLHCQKMH
ncbi:uncharacterized protein isoform X1 [Musca autumnalis]|uniref:uncharacterized protein isoform X1 n=1 Tax=Musca autumnalis TaxID=221902 RepID=UPI003CF4C8E5